MKIKVIKGTVTHEGKDYFEGAMIQVPDENAERLINLGFATIADKKSDKNEQSETESRKPADGGVK